MKTIYLTEDVANAIKWLEDGCKTYMAYKVFMALTPNQVKDNGGIVVIAQAIESGFKVKSTVKMLSFAEAVVKMTEGKKVNRVHIRGTAGEIICYYYKPLFLNESTGKIVYSLADGGISNQALNEEDYVCNKWHVVETEGDVF